MRFAVREARRFAGGGSRVGAGGSALVSRVAIGLLCVSGAGLGGCHEKRESSAQGTSAELAPAPAPAELLAEGVIATPDATWQRLQRGVGGAAGLLPTTLGGIVCAATGLDARLGAEINGGAPAYLVLSGDPALPAWVLAMRLVEERRARPLFEGASAIFEVRDAGGGAIELAAKGRPGPLGSFVGIAPGGWVVLASAPQALTELAPYATRTLPTKRAEPAAGSTESIAIDVPQSALGGSLATTLARGWADTERAMLANDRALRDAHGGRAPDFGDPRAIVTALDGWTQKKLAALRDLRGLHLGIDVREEDVSAVVTAVPSSHEGAAADAVAALHPGDIAPLGRVPRETVVGLLARDDAAARAKDAIDLEAALVTTLGDRLPPADARRVHTAIDDWYGARGDWATVAVTLTPIDRGAVGDVAASDPGRASRAVREALDLLAHAPAIREPFGAWLHVRDVKLGGGTIPGGARASLASFTTDTPSPFALAWTPESPPAGTGTGATAAAPVQSAHAGELKLALGAAPLPWIAPALSGGTLGDDPAFGAILAAIGPVAGAIVAQPGRSPGCTATGGVVAAWGTRPTRSVGAGQAEQALWATLVASDSSLRCAAKMFF
jgi:hypothetical protein